MITVNTNVCSQKIKGNAIITLFLSSVKLRNLFSMLQILVFSSPLSLPTACKTRNKQKRKILSSQKQKCPSQTTTRKPLQKKTLFHAKIIKSIGPSFQKWASLSLGLRFVDSPNFYTGDGSSVWDELVQRSLVRLIMSVQTYV